MVRISSHLQGHVTCGLWVAGAMLEAAQGWMHQLGLVYARDLVSAGDMSVWPGADTLPKEALYILQRTINVRCARGPACYAATYTRTQDLTAQFKKNGQVGLPKLAVVRNACLLIAFAYGFTSAWRRKPLMVRRR